MCYFHRSYIIINVIQTVQFCCPVNYGSKGSLNTSCHKEQRYCWCQMLHLEISDLYFRGLFCRQQPLIYPQQQFNGNIVFCFRDGMDCDISNSKHLSLIKYLCRHHSTHHSTLLVRCFKARTISCVNIMLKGDLS